MYFILIKLTNDVPERGRHWTKDAIIQVNKELAEKLIRDGNAKLHAPATPVKPTPWSTPPKSIHEEEE